MNSTNVFLLPILTFGLAINLCEVIFDLRSSISIIQVALLVISVGWMGFLFGAESTRESLPTKESLSTFGNACFELGVASTRKSP